MVSKIEEIFYAVVKTRLHVAAIYYFIVCRIIAATAHIDFRPYIPVILAYTIWHYALYLYDRAYDAHLDNINNAVESLHGKYRNLLMYISILLVLAPVLILFYYKQPILPYLFFIPITFLYNLRIFPANKAFKHFTLIKNLYSAVLIWPLPVAVILKFYVGMDNYLIEIMYWFIPFIIFVLMGEIIWDMRDVIGDRSISCCMLQVISPFLSY